MNYENLKTLSDDDFLNSFMKYIDTLPMREVIKLDSNIDLDSINYNFINLEMKNLKDYNDLSIYYIYIKWFRLFLSNSEKQKTKMNEFFNKVDKNESQEPYSIFWDMITTGELKSKFMEFEEFKDRFLSVVL